MKTSVAYQEGQERGVLFEVDDVLWTFYADSLDGGSEVRSKHATVILRRVSLEPAVTP